MIKSKGNKNVTLGRRDAFLAQGWEIPLVCNDFCRSHKNKQSSLYIFSVFFAEIVLLWEDDKVLHVCSLCSFLSVPYYFAGGRGVYSTHERVDVRMARMHICYVNFSVATRAQIILYALPVATQQVFQMLLV